MNTNDINTQKAAAVAEVNATADLAALEAARVKFLGRNGLLPQFMAAIKDVPGPEKKEFGQAANAFRNEVQTAVDARKEILSAQAEAAKSAAFDYTLPGSWPSLGSKHPHPHQHLLLLRCLLPHFDALHNRKPTRSCSRQWCSRRK